MTVSRPAALYDVCIVGAGPVGATCAWYLARQGRRVLLLDKARFPRDKLCGDAVTAGAQVHLDRMGVLPAVLAAQEGRGAAEGGFVSPSGARAMGSSEPRNGRALVIAIKRVVLDHRIARAAVEAGAELVEASPVATAEFSAPERAWTISCRSDPPRAYRARVLVAADGALSRLARSLGIVTTPPDAVCSRAYVRAGTDRCTADGLVFYPRFLLPGYCAVVREADGELNFCCYVIPGGSTALTDLRAVHEWLVSSDPRSQRGARSRCEHRPDAGRAASPGGRAAELRPALSRRGRRRRTDRSLDGRGNPIWNGRRGDRGGDAGRGVSRRRLERGPAPSVPGGVAALVRPGFSLVEDHGAGLCPLPGLLDASAAAVQRRGAEFLNVWAEIMTGVRPKRSLLAPRLLVPLAAAVAGEWWTRGRRRSSPVAGPHRSGDMR